MPPRLKNAPQIWKLARDLGLKSTLDPVNAVLHFCDQQIKTFLSDLPGSQTPSELLDLVAQKVWTFFEIVRTDRDLLDIQEKYLVIGEKSFVTLDSDLTDDVYGITFKRLKRQPWEPQYVSIIDCRGDKAARSYYTKWHEIAHLLTLTDQMRLSFRRTHCSTEKDPEEALMDVIAGKFAFYSPMVRDRAKGEVSFESIEKLRKQLCSEASQRSSIIGMVKAWPNPCVLIQAKMGLRRHEEALLRQGKFDFVESQKEALRATRITINDTAREMGIYIFENMRVPERSVIYQTFTGNTSKLAEASEDLSWWETSTGKQLPSRKIRVMARSSWDCVEALIIPL